MVLAVGEDDDVVSVVVSCCEVGEEVVEVDSEDVFAWEVEISISLLDVVDVIKVDVVDELLVAEDAPDTARNCAQVSDNGVFEEPQLMSMTL